MRTPLLMILALALAPVGAAASDLPLERVFESPALSGPTPRQPRLSPDGKYVTLLRNRADDNLLLVGGCDLCGMSNSVVSSSRSPRARSIRGF